MSSPIEEQEPPKPSTGDVWLLVLKDMEERRQHGIEKYGTPVQPFNGRDALVDAYQEALDLCVYLRQAIEERTRPISFTARNHGPCAKCSVDVVHAYPWWTKNPDTHSDAQPLHEDCAKEWFLS